MAATAARPSRTVIWSKPDMPVLMGQGPSATSLITSEPANGKFIGNSLRKGAELLGGLDSKDLTPHAIRRGAAAELDFAGHSLEGGAELAVQRALNHSTAAADQGITRQYIGPWREDTLAARIKYGPNPLIAAGLGFTADSVPYTTPKFSKDAVDAKCEEMGLDVASRASAAAARRVLQREHHDAWAAAQRALLDGDVAQAPPAARVDGDGGGAMVITGNAAAPDLHQPPSSPPAADAPLPAGPGSGAAEYMPLTKVHPLLIDARCADEGLDPMHQVHRAEAAQLIRDEHRAAWDAAQETGQRPPEGVPALPGKIPSGMIAAKCAELGIDPKLRMSRLKAGYLARAEHLAAWQASQQKPAPPPEPEMQLPTPAAFAAMATGPLPVAGKDPEESSDGDDDTDTDTDSDGDDDDDAVWDLGDSLLDDAPRGTTALFPASASAAEVSEAGRVITGDGDAFCRHFSTINILTFADPKACNSRLRPTYGGSAGHPDTRVAPEAVKRRSAANAASQARRGPSGPWKPRGCPECPPTATETYKTPRALSDHLSQAHSTKGPWIPRGCPLPGCYSSKQFKTAGALQKHFYRQHPDLSPADRATYCGTSSKRKRTKENDLPLVLQGFKPQQCSHPECPTQPLFFRADHYLDHATREHNVSADDMGPLVKANPPALDTLGDGTMLPQRCPICSRQGRPTAFLSLPVYLQHCQHIHALDEATARARLASSKPGPPTGLSQTSTPRAGPAAVSQPLVSSGPPPQRYKAD